MRLHARLIQPRDPGHACRCGRAHAPWLARLPDRQCLIWLLCTQMCLNTLRAGLIATRVDLVTELYPGVIAAPLVIRHHRRLRWPLLHRRPCSPASATSMVPRMRPLWREAPSCHSLQGSQVGPSRCGHASDQAFTYAMVWHIFDTSGISCRTCLPSHVPNNCPHNIQRPCIISRVSGSRTGDACPKVN